MKLLFVSVINFILDFILSVCNLAFFFLLIFFSPLLFCFGLSSKFECVYLKFYNIWLLFTKPIFDYRFVWLFFLANDIWRFFLYIIPLYRCEMPLAKYQYIAKYPICVAICAHWILLVLEHFVEVLCSKYIHANIEICPNSTKTYIKT